MSQCSSNLYQVKCTPCADDYIRDLKNRATKADGTPRVGPYRTAYEALRHVLDAVIPEHAFHPKFALGTKGGVRLSGIYRHKIGRLRVFWIASKSAKTAIVLFIGYRKEGDKKDAYEQFTQHLSAGDFDHYFGELGQSPPKN